MRKLGNIVVNEYIKILMKISTIVMLIAVVVVAVGYNGLKALESFERQQWSNSYYYQSYDEEINWTKVEKYEGWEERVEILTFLKENNITQNYYNDDYWTNTAAHVMFAQRSEAETFLMAGETEQAEKCRKYAEELEKAIKYKDWKIYNRINAETAEAAIENFENLGELSFKEHLEIELWAAKYRFENEIPPFTNNWKNSLVESVQNNKATLINLKETTPDEQIRKEMAAAEEAVLVGQYRLDNDIRVITSEANGVMSGNDNWGTKLNFWDVFTTSAMGINVISVLIIIIAGSVISSEFSTGTVKYLLVNPVKRYKIFIAKYISVLTFAILMLLIYYVFNIFLSGVLFGFGDFAAPHLYVSGGKVMQGSSFLFVASKYLVSSIGMICMATLAFAISSVAKSSALSIGAGVFLYVAGWSIVGIMAGLNLDFGRYLIFANLELNAIAEGISPFRGQTIPFALTVIAAYMSVFLLTAWDGFVRRDIK